MQEQGVGIICPLLLYPSDRELPRREIQNGNQITSRNGIQHAGIRFFEDVNLACFRGYNLGSLHGIDLDQKPERNGISAAVTGAAMFCRKKNNYEVLKSRFGYGLRRAIRRDWFAGDAFWSDGKVTVAFAVTETGARAKAGDYYTAMELGRACETELCWKTQFLERNKKWYDLRDVDLLIVMVDAYDLQSIEHAKPGLIKVARIRNWFDRWAERPRFDDYDLFFCSQCMSTSFK